MELGPEPRPEADKQALWLRLKAYICLNIASLHHSRGPARAEILLNSLESRRAECPFPPLHPSMPHGRRGGTVPSPTPSQAPGKARLPPGTVGLAATQPLPASEQPSEREQGRI